MAELCQEITYQDGEIIFQEGSDSSELFIILQGMVEILLNPGLVSDRPRPGTDPVVVATLHRGQSFGEIALVDHGLRSATARAAQPDTRLLILPSQKLLEYCELDPAFGFRLMQNLAEDLALKIRNADLLIREGLLYNSINRANSSFILDQ